MTFVFISFYTWILDYKKNKIRDKIEKSRVLFNHEFYDVLVEIDDIAGDFELVCKTNGKTFSFVIPKNALEYSELPLDKIYASEQIKRAEKYIEARRYDDSKGYKEQIVEIAVQYQIDSKYTAFIAVNERDEKLTDIPELQDTVLESPMGWDMDLKYSMKPLLKRAVRTKSAGLFNNIINETASCLFAEPDFSEETDYLFEIIKSCEEMITNNDDYKDLLDGIIEELKPHFSSPGKEYKALFKKMKEETPKVYALIEPFLR